ncbi:MAG: enoyl-CoA hydratase/isomerase family protein [Thermoleophilia bacterium]|nr:enoyl-CoA hydratase/isomerase family protein [Thermoleophilia bacterium]
MTTFTLEADVMTAADGTYEVRLSPANYTVTDTCVPQTTQRRGSIARMTLLPELEHIRVDRDGPVTRVTLDRPKIHNAFGSRMIEELGSVFTELRTDDQTRVIVLAGEGKSFSAGADINWMRDSVSFTRQQNVDDATRLALMLESIARCDKPVVCRVQGLALGGGLGLISAADYVVAEDSAEFAFSEVKLGLVPAVISPFVLRRIGPGHARALFITGERFTSERALRIGLVHVSVPSARLDAEIDRVVNELLTAAPDGVTISKHLVEDVSYHASRDMQLHTAETIASKRTDIEGQEGLNAFLEKRRPTWMDEAHAPAWLATSAPGTAR